MNIFELNIIITQLIEENDPKNDALLNFYYKAREELFLELLTTLSKTCGDPNDSVLNEYDRNTEAWAAK